MNENLWASIRNGTPDAYNALYKEYAVLMFGYGMKLVANVEVVEDAIQSVFVNLYRQRNLISTPTSIKAYMLGALRNEICRCHNQRKRYVQWEENANMSEIESSYDFRLEIDTQSLLEMSEARQEQYVALQKALDALPARQRDAVYLKYYNGLSGEEIAQVMGINYQTARTTLMNALNNLRKEMLVPADVLTILLMCFLS